MVDFYLQTDRINNYKNKKIRELIIVDKEVNIELLVPFLRDLEMDIFLIEILKKPIYSELYNYFIKQKDINKLIKNINLYSSEFNNLVDIGMIKLNNRSSEHLESNNGFFDPFFEIIIIDNKEFKKLQRKTFKEFAFVVLLIKRRKFLVSFLDEISKMGPFNEIEIFKLKEQVQTNQKKFEDQIKPYLLSEIKAKKSRKVISLNLQTKERIHVGPYKTFLLKKVESNAAYLKSANNEIVLINLWKDLIQGGFIERSSIEALKAIFEDVKIKKDKRIIWTKTIKTLTEFVKILKKSGKIVELNGVDHWLITIDCFTLKNNKEIPFNSIYKAQNKDSELKTEIESIVKKFCANLE